MDRFTRSKIPSDFRPKNQKGDAVFLAFDVNIIEFISQSRKELTVSIRAPSNN